MEVKMREQKKETKAQLERRIKQAVVFVEKDKDTKSVFFSDKGLRLTVTSDTAVVETGYHRHLFSHITNTGISRPYLYISRLVDIALDNDCLTENGLSFFKLLATLKDKTEQAEYNIATFVDWWLFNIFQPLFLIGESEVESFLVYEDYLHNIARNSIVLSEKTDDVTNKSFINRIGELMQEFTANMNERTLFEKKTDEQVMQENINAIQEQELESTMKEQADEGKN